MKANAGPDGPGATGGTVKRDAGADEAGMAAGGIAIARGFVAHVFGARRAVNVFRFLEGRDLEPAFLARATTTSLL